MSSSGTGSQPTASGRASAAATVGGMRTAGRRPGRGSVQKQGSGSGQPNNNIMRFYSDDGSGLKMGPVTVLVMSLAFMVIVVSLHILGKFRSALSG